MYCVIDLKWWNESRTLCVCILLGSKNYHLLHLCDVLKVLVLLLLFFTVWFPKTAGVLVLFATYVF